MAAQAIAARACPRLARLNSAMPGATATVQRGAEKVAKPRDAAPDTAEAATGKRHRHSRANGPISSNAYTSGVSGRYTPPSAAALLAPTTWKKPATTAAP